MALVDTSVAQPPQVDARPSRSTLVRLAQIAACVGIPAIILFAPWDIPANTKAGLAISAFMIMAWMTEVMEYGAAGLVGPSGAWADA